MENINTSQNNEHPQVPIKKAYSIVCTKLGIIMCVFFICRFLAGQFSNFLVSFGTGLNITLLFIIQYTVLVLLVYIVPMLVAIGLFNSHKFYKGKMAGLYKKPKRLARALGTFPAMFGLGHGTALLTFLAAFLLSRITGGETLIDDLFQPATIEASANIVYIIAMVFMLVVIAPVFEEFLTRGIMFDALRPFGAGISIIITSILFGLMHGSLYMLFYTTAYGFALGYIRYATNSLLIVTILHAIVNGIGALALVFSSLLVMTNQESRVINSLYSFYLVALLIAVIVGIIVFITKIPSMKKYKIENPWTEISAWKKIGVFFMSIPVIIMLVLSANELSMGILLRFITG